MWSLNFISRKDFKQHVKNTICTYEKTLEGINLEKFNSNIVDPIKMVFDSKVYKKEFEEVIKDELVRQRDKTNSNAIGYFHQNMFKYINNCEVPNEGFDIIYTDKNGTKKYIEMKNKHNTMNSSSSQKTYMRMLNKIANESTAECYLVEVIAKNSQNIVWKLSLEGEKVENERIKRISIDKFYEIVTGDAQAFYKICMELPKIIDEIIEENKELQVEDDTAIAELKERNPDLLKSLYILAFNEYAGFDKLK